MFGTTKPPSDEGGGTVQAGERKALFSLAYPITDLLCFKSVGFNVLVNNLLEFAACLKLVKSVVNLFLELGVLL